MWYGVPLGPMPAAIWKTITIEVVFSLLKVLIQEIPLRALPPYQQFKNPSNVQIVEDKNQVYIAAQGIPTNNNPLKNVEIFLINSSVTQDNFQKTVNISNNSGVSECPSLAASGNNLYMTWEDSTPGNHEILFSTKTWKTIS